MNHEYSNREAARPRDADLIESLVWIVFTLAGFSFLLYQCQEYIEYVIAPAAIIIPTIIIWRVTAFYRKRRHFKNLKSQLQMTIRTYRQAKETIEALPPGDRELAAGQLEAIKKAGLCICKELSTFRAELRDAKQSVLTKLGEVSDEEVAKKLAPIRVLEVEVEQLLQEFESIAQSDSKDR